MRSWRKLPEKLLVEWGEQNVLTLTLNRPERRNALDPELLAALAGALRTHGKRAGAIILRGAGDAAFSAGYDLDHLTGTDEDLHADANIGTAVDSLRDCAVAVIALVRGHCHGAAVELAMNCDLRLATPDLRLSVPAVSLGVVYRYEFITRLVAICGLNRTSDLLLGMRELDAPTALAWGLLTEVVDAAEIEARVWDVAERIATAPRPAVQGTKASLNLRVKRNMAGEDLLEANRLRRYAAMSPQRFEALMRRKKK
jgi:enoyl-CoA hydratase/carnithine racemase